jgi:type IX secretion system PorP/SprF family membrane protein
MQKILTLSAAALLAVAAYKPLQAQQEPLFAQYNTNMYLINPAVAGAQGGHSLRLFHRWQWVSFPGAPKTYGMTYQGLIKDLHGVGALLVADQTGPLGRVGGKVAYAFHMPLANRKSRLSIGVAGRYMYNRVRTNAITFIEQNDQAVSELSDGVGMMDAEFGVYYHSPTLYAGFSAPNLVQTTMDFGSNRALRQPLGRGYRHFFFNAGYRFTVGNKEVPKDSTGKKIGISKAITFEPSIMVKYVKGAAVQVDGGLTVHFLENALSFGVFYRTPHFLSFQTKFVFDKQIPVLLAFDIAVANFQQYSVGATEVMMGYDFPRRDMYSAPLPTPIEDKTEKK